jgi:catechol 2,3-dioxygenase-like lactoylglutathione lyase family enzyme
MVTGLGHVGIICDDFMTMRDFYSRVIGLTITDEDPEHSARGHAGPMPHTFLLQWVQMDVHAGAVARAGHNIKRFGAQRPHHVQFYQRRQKCRPPFLLTPAQNGRNDERQHHDNSSSNTFASWRSAVSKPSVNQP